MIGRFEAVECSYKDIKHMWSSQDYKRNLNVGKSVIALLHASFSLLCNFKVCLAYIERVDSNFNCLSTLLGWYVLTIEDLRLLK